MLRGLSLVEVSRATLHYGVWASHCGSFSCCTVYAPGICSTEAQASVVAASRLGSCDSQALECGLSNGGT